MCPTGSWYNGLKRANRSTNRERALLQLAPCAERVVVYVEAGPVALNQFLEDLLDLFLRLLFQGRRVGL